jgi:general secretion pathway protein E
MARDGGRFAGERLSPRFLKEERLFPYEDRSGGLTLAIARPIEDETIRAAEIALQREVTIAVATADDIDAALASRTRITNSITVSNAPMRNRSRASK